MTYALPQVTTFPPGASLSDEPVSDKKEYRIITRVKNNLLLSAIEAAGYGTVSRFAEVTKVNAATIGALINFKISPVDNNGDWRPCIHAICEVLNKMPSQLFTEAQTQLVDAKVKVTEVSEAEACWALEYANENNPQRCIEKQELNEALYNAIDTLPPREKEVLTLYYGLEGEPMTFREIGEKFNLSGQRIINIHDRALLLLKGRRRAEHMKQITFLRRT